MMDIKSMRKEMEAELVDNILPFWEKDVLQYVKDGKTRRFDMILN